MDKNLLNLLTDFVVAHKRIAYALEKMAGLRDGSDFTPVDDKKNQKTGKEPIKDLHL